MNPSITLAMASFLTFAAMFASQRLRRIAIWFGSSTFVVFGILAILAFCIGENYRYLGLISLTSLWFFFWGLLASLSTAIFIGIAGLSEPNSVENEAVEEPVEEPVASKSYKSTPKLSPILTGAATIIGLAALNARSKTSENAASRLIPGSPGYRGTPEEQNKDYFGNYKQGGVPRSRFHSYFDK
jgi:hypothetical protein